MTVERQGPDRPSMVDRVAGQGRPSSSGPNRASANGSAAVEQRIQFLARYVREQAQERPYVMVACGAAAGYVLGGRLTLRLARFVLTNAGRAAAAHLVAAGIRGTRASWRTP
jgi:hypothetical protein